MSIGECSYPRCFSLQLKALTLSHERARPANHRQGSLVLFNAFAISHDESIYADPWRFDPDRYLPREEGGRGESLPTAHFGFGRR